MNNTDLTDDLVFLMYSIRPGIDIPGYEQWLKDIDCPFFNRFDTIHYYANWKIIDGFYNVPFSMFDFMAFKGLDDLEASWSDPELLQFTVDWELQWGNDPSGAVKARNYRVSRFKRTQDGPRDGDFCVIGFDQGEGPVPSGSTVWQLEEAMVGEDIAQRLIVQFHEDEADARTQARDMNGGLGTAITSP